MVDFLPIKIKPHFNAANLIVIQSRSTYLRLFKRRLIYPVKILFWKGYGDGDLTKLAIVL